MALLHFSQTKFLTHSGIIIGALALAMASSSTAQASKIDTQSHASPMLFPPAALPKNDPQTLVMADGKGDRGMLAPYTHHKNGFGYLYTSYMFDTLLGQDPKGNPAPNLAKSWELSDDGLMCELILSKNAQWHDGRPVTIDDVTFTFAYMTKHPYAYVSLDAVKKVEAIGSDKIRITLKYPDASLLSAKLIAMPILPKHIYEKQPIPARFLSPKAAIGSGPYKLVSYDKAVGRYTFAKNPNYSFGQAKFDNLAIVRMGADAAIQAAKTGQVDVIARLPYDRIDAARESGLNVTTASSNLPARLAFNHHKRLKDKQLRHALAYAIDRKAILDIVFRGGGLVAETGYFQKDSPWHGEQGDPAYSFNPAKAAKLLTDFGWKRNTDGTWLENGQPVKFSLIAGKEYKKLAQVVSGQLGTFGIATDLRILGRSVLSSRIKENDYDLALLSISTIGDPVNIARRVMGGSWKGDRFRSNAEMKSVIKAQQKANDPKEREKLLHRFQALYAEELPSYMLVNPYWAIAYNNKVAPYFVPNGVAFGIPLAVHKYTFMH